MTTQHNPSGDYDTCSRTGARLNAQIPPSTPSEPGVPQASRPPSDEQLLNELRVHRIKVEMQNEELRKSRAETETVTARYADLYDFAPVGYFTLDPAGHITRANLTGAHQLNTDHERLGGQCFEKFVAETDRPTFAAFLRNMGEGRAKACCEVALLKTETRQPWMRIEGTVSADRREFRLVLMDITEHRQADDALRESEERFRRIFEESPIGMATISSDLHFMRVNTTFCTMLGYNEDELAELTIKDITHPAHIAENLDAVIKVIDGLIPYYRAEKRYIRKDHEVIWGAVTVTSVRDRDGQFRCLIAMIENITARRLADEQAQVAVLEMQSLLIDAGNSRQALLSLVEEQKAAENLLRKSEEKFRNLYDSMSEGVALHQLLYDSEGIAIDYVMLAVNPAYETITGLKAAAVVGRKASSIYGTGSAPYLDLFATVGATRQPAHFETTFEAMGKSFRISAFSPATGQFATVFEDITERKREEIYRQLSTTVLTIINEGNDVGDTIQQILTAIKSDTKMDALGIRLRHGNDYPYFAQIGFTTEFLRTENSLAASDIEGGLCKNCDGKILLECTCGLVISGKTDPSNSLFTPGGSCWTNNSTSLLQLSPGSDPRLNPRNRCIREEYLSLALIPIRAKTEIVGLLQLNSRTKDYFTRSVILILESVASHIGEALMRKQGEAEHDRLEAQFRQAQKMESVGRLAGGVAHDFNNLLMGIMGYAELCKDHIDSNSPIRPWLDEIATGAQRSAAITRQLLAFARKQTITPKVLDLNDAISNMLKLLRRMVGEDIEMVWMPGARSAVIKMDPSQIDQIIANLAVNARDAIGGVGRLVIETGNTTFDETFCAEHDGAIPGMYVMLSVSDNGCGMDKATIEKIFDPFFTTKEVGKGTGLGLATVYGIVKQNNGFVTVASEPGNGSTFTIYLPRFTGDAADAMAVVESKKRPGGNETIMLVEDEKSVRVTTKASLDALGYVVLAAESPQKAMRMMAEHSERIHLLITDVVMPGMSGGDLATHMQPLRPDMKCIFMSGYTSDVIVHRGVVDKDVDFLLKPFTRDQLATKVREVLDR